MQKSYIFYQLSSAEAFHRKLLLQMEEAVESQFNDAKRRITAINEASFLLLCVRIFLCIRLSAYRLRAYLANIYIVNIPWYYPLQV